MKQEQKLNGSIQEQVNQFIALVKEKTLSVDALSQLVPMTTDFIKTLAETIKQETEAGKERYGETIKRIDTILNVLSNICKDNKITSDERIAVINALSEVAEILHDTENHHNDNEHWTKRILAVLAVIVIIPIGILAASQK